jgi:hypothetical protein
LQLIGEALGYATSSSFSSDGNATETIGDGAVDNARALYFKVTSGVSLTATRTLTIAPNTVSRVMFIENATTGSQSIEISQGSGANVTIGSGLTKCVYLDGAGAAAAVVDVLALCGGPANHIFSAVQALGNSSGATLALDWNSGNMATLTNNGNPSSISAPLNPVTGGNYAITIKAAAGATDGSGWTWPSTFKWRGNTAPTLTTTLNYSDVVTLIYDGTNYLASYTTGHPG